MPTAAHKDIALLSQALAPAGEQVDPIMQVSEVKRQKAYDKAAVVIEVQRLVDHGQYKSHSKAIAAWLTAARRAPSQYPLAYKLATRKIISKASIHNWVKAYAQQGIMGLVEQRGGSKAKIHGWEDQAEKYFRMPTKPDCGSIAWWLRDEGYDVSVHQVRAFINRLDEMRTTMNPSRVGWNHWKQNHAPFASRDMSDVPVGACYMGDGHMCDTYIAHPNNGKPWTPELTIWIDWRSHYVPGFFFSNAESAITSLHSLAAIIDQHQHVPLELYVDPGSGFKNKQFSMGDNSFCARNGIDVHYADKGNAKEKGLVEGWFNWYEKRLGRKFLTTKTTDRTDDMLRMLTAKVKQGKVILPSFSEYKTAVSAYIESYNKTPQKGLEGKSPAELWKALKAQAPIENLFELQRPHVTRTVQKGGRIHYENVIYFNGALIAKQGQRLTFAVDLNDVTYIDVKNADGSVLCRANLLETKKAVAPSHYERKLQEREKNQIKLLKIKEHNLREQNKQPIDTQAVIDNLALFNNSADLVDDQSNASNPLDDINTSSSFNLEDIY